MHTGRHIAYVCDKEVNSIHGQCLAKVSFCDLQLLSSRQTSQVAHRRSRTRDIKLSSSSKTMHTTDKSGSSQMEQNLWCKLSSSSKQCTFAPTITRQMIDH